MHSLPLFVRLNGRPVILLGDGETADAKRRLLDRAGAMIVGEEAQAALAIVALDDDAEAEAAIARLKARGVLVNAVDRPSDCDYTLPAIVDRDPVLIAIGTGGASAGLAKALRQRLEGLLPATLGPLAQTLLSARSRIKSIWPHPADRRKAIDAALDPGGPLDPFVPFEEQALEKWLASPEAALPPQALTFTISSDDPEEMSLRLAKALGRADLIIHTPDVPPAILNRARADAGRERGDRLPDPLPPGLTLFIYRA
jgi:uroporphyrin-III C-methyltransferase / precorrin-2 dehydrogenase / sirohydrochlorin ferrochelatase